MSDAFVSGLKSALQLVQKGEISQISTITIFDTEK